MMSKNYSVTKHAERTSQKLSELTQLDENFDSDLIKKINQYVKTQIRRAYTEGTEAKTEDASLTLCPVTHN